MPTLSCICHIPRLLNGGGNARIDSNQLVSSWNLPHVTPFSRLGVGGFGPEMICNGPISLSRQVWVVDFGLELLSSILWKICKSILWNGWVSGLASTHATFFGDFPETIKAKWTTGWMRRVDWEILVGCLMHDNYVFTKKPLDRVNFSREVLVESIKLFFHDCGQLNHWRKWWPVYGIASLGVLAFFHRIESIRIHSIYLDGRSRLRFKFI